MTNLNKSIAILNTKAPFAQSNAKESMDVALIFGTYEQNTHLFFQGDGVYQLLNKQTPDNISIKDFLKTFSAFEFYDLNNIYVCQRSLTERKLLADFHINNVQVLSNEDFTTALHQHSVILNF
jgi:tRNA 2-thiouridine synthesizing protein C